MENIIDKLTLSRNLIVDCCDQTSSVAKWCMLLSLQKWFVECDLDLERSTSSLFQLVLAFAQKPLTKKSDITGKDDLQQAGFTFVKAMKDLDLKLHIYVQEMPAGFPTMRTFPLLIIFHLSTYHMEYSLYEQTKYISKNVWALRWCLQLDMLDICSMLAIDCGTVGVKVNTSSIFNDSVGCGVFLVATVQCWRDKGILLWDVSLLKPFKAKNAQKAYADGALSITVNDFTTLSLKVPKMVWYCIGERKSAWMVPVCFCCMRLTNDSCYIPDEKSMIVQRRMQPMDNKLYFVIIPLFDSASKVKDYRKISAEALRNIEIYEEVYMNHDSEYSFLQLRTQEKKANLMPQIPFIFSETIYVLSWIGNIMLWKFQSSHLILLSIASLAECIPYYTSYSSKSQKNFIPVKISNLDHISDLQTDIKLQWKQWHIVQNLIIFQRFDRVRWFLGRKNDPLLPFLYFSYTQKSAFSSKSNHTNLFKFS